MTENQNNIVENPTNIEENEALQKVEALKKQEQEINERIGRIGGISDLNKEGRITTFGDGFGMPHIAIDYISRGNDVERKKHIDKYMNERNDLNKRLDEIYKSGDVYSKDAGGEGYSVWVDQKLRTDVRIQELLKECDQLRKQFEEVRIERLNMER
ncbi:MAG: hypothetical protein QMD50_02660 [Patescibacteria group bacterium]|nr:hypothetical protein [Patescibacteria group bacterium]